MTFNKEIRVTDTAIWLIQLTDDAVAELAAMCETEIKRRIDLAIEGGMMSRAEWLDAKLVELFSRASAE